jgi:aminocarboxymuconate-semialdehyde decarboxylase
MHGGESAGPAGVVDVHTHYIPAEAAGFDAPGCVRLALESPTCGQLYHGDRHYRTIDERSWDAARRIVDMDARGVALQVISPIPVAYAYDASPADGRAFARLHNDAIAAVVRERPDRFAGLGGVPLHDVEAACGELERCVRDLGLLGVEIGTSAGGRDLDDPALEPFWERCGALGAYVFIHPENAPGFERARTHGLTISTAYPAETGLAAAKLLMSGVLVRHPEATIVLAHGGGTLPWILPRLDRVWEALPGVRASLDVRPSVLARRFVCDTLTFDAENLALVARRIGADRLMVGTDYPFPIMEDPPGAVLAGAAFSPDELAAIRGGTFRRLAARAMR